MSIIDVIQYEGSNKTLVWKHPAEDFNTLTQLIVHETQEAVFFKDGQALDLFGPGRYTLHTQNIPLLSNLVNLPFGGTSPFHCEVYFVNKTEQLAIKWGTDSRVQYTDPKLGFQFTVGASGEIGIAVQDSRKLLLKLVGTEAALGQDQFIGFMRGFINQSVKPYMAQVMARGDFSIFDVDAHMEEFAAELHQMLREPFEDYGIDLRRFLLTTIAKPVDDPNYQRELSLNAQQHQRIRQAEIDMQEREIRQIGQAHIDAATTVVGAEAMAEKRRREGYTYQQERGFDVSERVASNAAVGEFSSLGIGMGLIGGVGAPLAGGVAQMTGDALGSVAAGMVSGDALGSVAAGMVSAGPGVPGGQPAPDAAGQQGVSPVAPQPSLDPVADLKVRIDKLKLMHSEGLIDDSEFEARKQKLLDEI